MLKLFNKKALIISLVILSLFILTGLFIYFLDQKQKSGVPAGHKKQETLAEKQSKELEKLRNEANLNPLTEKQKQAQLKELEALRKKANIKPLSSEQIQKQLEELEKLRLAQ